MEVGFHALQLDWRRVESETTTNEERRLLNFGWPAIDEMR